MVEMPIYKFDCLAPNYEHCTFHRTYKVPITEHVWIRYK